MKANKQAAARGTDEGNNAMNGELSRLAGGCSISTIVGISMSQLTDITATSTSSGPPTSAQAALHALPDYNRDPIRDAGPDSMHNIAVIMNGLSAVLPSDDFRETFQMVTDVQEQVLHTVVRELVLN